MDAFSLGQHLRETRENRELTLENAETTLKIRRYILEGFESGNFNVLDISAVQIRGFLRNYARYLGLDEDTIIQYYESSLQPAGRRPRRKTIEPSTPVPRPPDKRSTDTHPTITQSSRPKSKQRTRSPLLRLLLFGILGGAAVGIIAFVASDLIGFDFLSPEVPAAFSGTEQPTDESRPTLTITPFMTPTVQIGATLIPRSDQSYLGQPVLVTIEFAQRAWIRVIADNTEVFSGIVRPNEIILEYPANNSIVVTTSNADALLVTYNGQPQPPYGTRGQSIEIVFQPENDITVSALGAVALAATDTPEDSLPVLELTPVTDDIDLEISGTVTPIPTSLPLIPGAEVSPTSNVIIPTLATDNTITPAAEVTTTGDTEASTAAPTTAATAVVELTPSVTPTSEAVLPPRITPTPVAPPKGA